MVPAPASTHRPPPTKLRRGRIEKVVAACFLLTFLALAAVRIISFLIWGDDDPPYRIWVNVGTTILGAALAVFCYSVAVRSLAYRRRAHAEMERLNDSLRHKVAELEATFDIIPVGLVIADDPTCRSLRGNAVMEKLLGVPGGGNLSKSAPVDELPQYRCYQYGRELRAEELPMQVAAATGVLVEGFEFDLVRDDHTLKLSGSAVPLFDDAGRPRGAIGAFWDIAEFKAVEDRLIDERDAAEAAAVAKDRFVADVSHDLRTPLHAILLLADRVRRAQFEPGETRTAIDNITELCRAQQQLIGDLLDLTRIAQGVLWLERRPVSITAVAEAACETLRPAAERKGVRLRLELAAADAGHDTVSGDAVRLEQVFWNLLSNAVKFTPAGGEVQVRLEQETAHVRASVTDTGRGIDPELLPHVFERLRRDRRAAAVDRDGLGLGLSIVKHVVELHGGTVHADSAGRGCGATFNVRLPLLLNSEARPSDDGVPAVGMVAAASPA